MKFNKIYSFLVLSILLILGCSPKAEENGIKHESCADVSVRLMYSVVEDHYSILLEKLQEIDTIQKKELIHLIAEFQNLNSELIIEGGGFDSGKSLKMINPCEDGKRIGILFSGYRTDILYEKYITALNKSGLISSDKMSNMKFIVEAYFCKDNCTFSPKNLEKQSISFLTLQQLVLQFTLLDLLFL